jgi:hypothetical protein
MALASIGLLLVQNANHEKYHEITPFKTYADSPTGFGGPSNRCSGFRGGEGEVHPSWGTCCQSPRGRRYLAKVYAMKPIGRVSKPPRLFEDRPQAKRDQIMGMFIIVIEETPEFIRVKSRVDGNISVWMRQGRSDRYTEEDGP